MPCGHPGGQQGLRNPHRCWQPLLCPSQLFFCPCLLLEPAQRCLAQTEAESTLGPQHHTAAQKEHGSWETQTKNVPKWHFSGRIRTQSLSWRPNNFILFIFLLFLKLETLTTDLARKKLSVPWVTCHIRMPVYSKICTIIVMPKESLVCSHERSLLLSIATNKSSA